eukprot:5730740-Amphidinium_carterae.1
MEPQIRVLCVHYEKEDTSNANDRRQEVLKMVIADSKFVMIWVVMVRVCLQIVPSLHADTSTGLKTHSAARTRLAC